MSLTEWHRELKVITGILAIVAVVEGGRRLLGFTAEKISPIDAAVWIGLLALVQLAKLLLDCTEAILNELSQIKRPGNAGPHSE